MAPRKYKPTYESTLCFCLQNGKILLALKKKGFGEGKWNGYGGKTKKVQTPEGERWETPEEGALRELREESSIVARAEDLEKVAEMYYFFPNDDGKYEEPLFKCHVYLLKDPTSEAKETDEMGNPTWYPMDVNRLPSKMWAGDRQLLPILFGKKKIIGYMKYEKDGMVVHLFSQEEVASF